MSTPKLLFLVTEDSYFYSHRLPQARAAQRAGFDVSVVTNVKNHRAEIEKEGIRVIPFSLERRSLNPFFALKHVAGLLGIYRRERPALVHHIAMKPVLLGGIAAWLARVPGVINAFAGLGYLFTSDSMLARILRPPLFVLFRIILRRRGSYLLLQNDDDLALLRRRSMVPKGRVTVIRGSGVDLEAIGPQAFVMPAPDFICAFAGRMIGIKGLQTMRDAFEVLARRAPHIKLWLCGTPDPANPGSWTQAQIDQWVAGSDNVTYKGFCKDMPAIWAQAHAALQPSWGGEGVPKSLLEAAACGRAIVATDVPGCRDMVADSDNDAKANGILVPPRDAQALAAAIEALAGDLQRCRIMGENSRRLVEEGGFSAKAVMEETAALYRTVLRESSTSML